MLPVGRKQSETPGEGTVTGKVGAVGSTVTGAGHTVTDAVGGAVGGARARVGDLGSFLKDQRTQARMSLRQVADVAGVSNPYLSQVERGLRHPSAEVLQQLARALRISAEALYVRAGLLEEGEPSPVPVAIASDPRLSERHKRVLLDVYASFVAEQAGPDPSAGDD